MPEEFRLDQAELTRIWTLFTEESDVKFFRQYVTSFVKSWEEQVSPNWELLVTSTMDGRRVEGPSLSGVVLHFLAKANFFSEPSMALSKDKLEDMDVSLKKVDARSGPTLQKYITLKRLTLFMSFFRI